MTHETYLAEEAGERIDKYLSLNTELSRSRIQELIKQGFVLVNGTKIKSSYQLNLNDRIDMDIPENQPVEIRPEDIPLDILYEDSDVIVINKPKGMIVHPAPGIYTGTLVNALLYHCKDLSGINGVIRPGIVHRIDKDTTGCIVCCKNDRAHQSIAAQLADKTCHREYRAIVKGIMEHDSGMIDAPIGRDPKDRQKMAITEVNSRHAVTRFKTLERYKDASYIECALETGRTHQIRVHMKYINHPVLGDLKYGTACSILDTHGQVLHACRLTFILPTTGKSMVFEAPLPAYFEELLEFERKENA